MNKAQIVAMLNLVAAVAGREDATAADLEAVGSAVLVLIEPNALDVVGADFVLLAAARGTIDKALAWTERQRAALKTAEVYLDKYRAKQTPAEPIGK